MSFKGRMVRAFFGGSILLIAQAVPAFAEKITLACSYGGNTVTSYITIDTVAKTVKESIWTTTDTYPARITDDAITWYSRKHNMSGTYNRQTRQLSNWMSFNGVTHAFDPVPCARAPAAPF